MTNESNKPKIKRSFKIAWEAAQELSQAEGQHLYGLDDIDEIFGGLWEAIRQLRKENKKLKKLQHANDALPYLATAWSFKTCPPIDLNMGKIGADCSLFTTGGNTQEPKPQAAAHFKCAKTNKPKKDGRFGVIYLFGGILKLNSVNYESGKWKNMTYEVLAFTETDPQEIINALNK